MLGQVRNRYQGITAAAVPVVVDDDRLRGIELTDGRVVPRAAAFLFPRPIPHDALLTRLGCEKDDTGWVVTNRTGRTSVAGAATLHVAGNARVNNDARRQRS